MASKSMMKNAIALFLTINLVFLGFTKAQGPPPPQAPVCPRDSINFISCSNVFRLSLILINERTVLPCCTLVAGLDAAAASACICNAVRVTIFNFLTINLRVNQVLRLCRILPPAGFRCA
ncbi:Bifunctional inhibitor/plant lipid transfer protein/seed storage helical domain superfamily [Arabidopsis suecica]|uniref:Bifunctional inhibitor/plant lipid transfer protein/seed storage helical domain superfamily n=1 Tax=Arabidopsis suecica TaxID=45249 RepID=A0A8T1YKK5_ARASU|nr:Bifunctional inhibitor/plant lipid transfer protein/seed storage helical domain superfamily [Arabidopsis suecica]